MSWQFGSFYCFTKRDKSSKTHVTQGDEKVEDAKKVEFEIWKSDEETHEKVLGEHQGNGIYSISKTFCRRGGITLLSPMLRQQTCTICPKRNLRLPK
jgi:hypothetical protein